MHCRTEYKQNFVQLTYYVFVFEMFYGKLQSDVSSVDNLQVDTFKLNGRLASHQLVPFSYVDLDDIGPFTDSFSSDAGLIFSYCI